MGDIPPDETDASNPHLAELRRRIRSMPHEPGIYRWLDRDGRLLYVGKAKDLRKRLSSYVMPSATMENFRKRGLLKTMADVEVTVTETEMDALILEMHLIRKQKPKYNVALTRDAHYAYVRISADDYPSVEVVQQKKEDGARYFGPYTNPWHQRRMLEVLRGVFKFRTCRMGMGGERLQRGQKGQRFQRCVIAQAPEQEKHPTSVPSATSVPSDTPTVTAPSASSTIPLQIILTRRDRRTPCLDYHIEQCVGPCGGEWTPEEYRSQCIDGVLRFLEGETQHVVERLVERMRAVSAERKFERAQHILSTLRYLEEQQAQRAYFDPEGLTADAVAVAQREGKAVAVVLQVRGGKVVNAHHLPLAVFHADVSEQLAATLSQFYSETQPPPLLLTAPFDDAVILAKWLRSQAGKRVRITHPRRGKQAAVLALALRNAERHLDPRSGAKKSAQRLWKAPRKGTGVRQMLAGLQTAEELA